MKRIFFLGILIFSLLAFPFSVSAAGFGDDTPDDDRIVFSYWNIDYMLAVRSDGVRVLFDFPNDFFYRESPTNETVTLQGYVVGTGVVSSSLSFSFSAAELNGISYMRVVFDNFSGFKDFEFHFTNSVIFPESDLSYSIMESPTVAVPLFNLWAYDDQSQDVTVPGVSSFSAEYSFVVPYIGEDLSFLSRSFFTSDLQSVFYDSGVGYYGLLMRTGDLTYIRSLMSSSGFPSYSLVPYIDTATTFFTLNDEYISSQLDIYLPVGTCHSRSDGSVAGGIRVSQWYDLFFGLYDDYIESLPPSVTPSLPSDVASGAAGFVGAVLSGIFSIELFPSIFIGGFVFCIVGLGFVFAFLRWFNGG